MAESMSAAPEKQVYYQCQRCTNCCRWPGDVRVSGSEVEGIATFLGMEIPAFVEKFTRLRADRRGLSLISRADSSCIFLDGRDCIINEVKPQQCRDFPTNGTSPAGVRFVRPSRWKSSP